MHAPQRAIQGSLGEKRNEAEVPWRCVPPPIDGGRSTCPAVQQEKKRPRPPDPEGWPKGLSADAGKARTDWEFQLLASPKEDFLCGPSESTFNNPADLMQRWTQTSALRVSTTASSYYISPLTFNALSLRSSVFFKLFWNSSYLSLLREETWTRTLPGSWVYLM